ncbi:hypothetical protein WMY93_004039 [Mugilogobius chulae]|uniref:CUB domain-containing protein n=1 Tax=Mugilogobius chulae TaxID=88201 RepID=A0AAW0PQ45_9GOBI
MRTSFFITSFADVSSDKCGGNIRISSASYLTSPDYPRSYPSSQRCTWVITAPAPHQRILINFNPHFDLEDRECNDEFIMNEKQMVLFTCFYKSIHAVPVAPIGHDGAPSSGGICLGCVCVCVPWESSGCVSCSSALESERN